MPSAISHIVAGASLGYSLNGGRRVFFFILAAFISILPDLDVLAFGFGIPYGDIFGHRGFFHSLVFSVIVSLALVLLCFRGRDFSAAERARIFVILFIIAASHPVLDAMTGGGLGIGLFIPFSNERIFLPWRPIAVSPIGIWEFFSEWGLRVMKSELRYVIFPSFMMVVLACIIRSAFRRHVQE